MKEHIAPSLPRYSAEIVKDTNIVVLVATRNPIG